jgi:nucleoside-diphosphate-sugar epimerase
LNFAVRRTADDEFDLELATGAEAVGLLMQRCQRAQAFLHCSTTGVYRPPGDHAARETDPLGDHHGPQLPTYSIGKIAAEAVARSGARAFDLPTVITRLSVPYGTVWGWPAFVLESVASGQPVMAHPDDPMWFNPIHERDLISQLGALLGAAAVPATIVNWAGDEAVQIGEWAQLMGEMLDVKPVVQLSDRAFRGVRVDCAKRSAITGPCEVAWRDGFAEMIGAFQANRERGGAASS